MFGLGMGEILLIAVVALLIVGPDKLPEAAKTIGKGIRDLRRQTMSLQNTIEQDTEIGEAVRELRGALRGDPETLYRRTTGTDYKTGKPASLPDTALNAVEPSKDGGDNPKSDAVDALSPSAQELIESINHHNEENDPLNGSFDEFGHPIPVEEERSSSDSESSSFPSPPDSFVIAPAKGTLARGDFPLSDEHDDSSQRGALSEESQSPETSKLTEGSPKEKAGG